MDIFAYVRRRYLYMTAPQCMTRPDVKPDATMRSNSLASVRAAPVHVRIRRITTEKNLFIRSPIDCMKIKKSQKYIVVFHDLHLGFAIQVQWTPALGLNSVAPYLVYSCEFFLFFGSLGGEKIGFFRKIMLILQNCTIISTLAPTRGISTEYS